MGKYISKTKLDLVNANDRILDSITISADTYNTLLDIDTTYNSLGRLYAALNLFDDQN